MSRTSTAGIKKEDVQDSTYVYAPDAGSTDSYVITLAQPITAYVSGQAFIFKANTANTGACSINIDGKGAIALKKQYNNDLVTGDILAGQIVHITYDGTNFQTTSDLSTVPADSGDMVLASAQTNTGLKTFLDASFGLRNVANTITSFFTNTATVARTWIFPNKDGTVAMTSDIPTALSALSDDATHRLVTDTEKNTWNGKQDAGSYEVTTNKSTSTSLGTSDTLYPSQNAVKTYVDGIVAGLLDYRGAYDASVNTFPASGGSGTAGAVMKGDMWIVSVAGTLGGTAVQIGDSLIASVDTPAQTASNWNILNANISYVPEDTANKVTSISGASTDTQYPSAKLVYDQLALKANLNSPTFTGTPTLPTGTIATTQSANDNSTKVATTAYADLKLPKAGGVMTGKVTEAGRDTVGATYTPASGSQTVALDCTSNNMHVVSGNANGTAITFTVTGATNSQPFIVSILQGGTTVSTITGWFATVRWAGGVAPTLTATLNKRDTFGFIRTGTNTYDGFVIGQNA